MNDDYITYTFNPAIGIYPPPILGKPQTYVNVYADLICRSEPIFVYLSGKCILANNFLLMSLLMMNMNMSSQR